MRDRVSREHTDADFAPDQPVYGVIVEQDEGTTVRYFSTDAEADAATAPSVTAEALSLAGAWSDLDWDEAEVALDRIRHESAPSAPLSL